MDDNLHLVEYPVQRTNIEETLMAGDMLTNIPNILVYRNHLLSVSETFIYNQTVNLQSYQAFFLGSKRFKGKNIDLPQDRINLINNGNFTGYIKDLNFKVTGMIPFNIKKWIEAINPVLIHAHLGPDGALALPISKQMKLPLIISLLGSDITISDNYSKRSFYSQRLFLRRREELINYASAVIVPSNFLKNRAKELGFKEESIYLIRHGVDLKSYKAIRHKTNYGHIVYVGRLIPLKGLNFLIKALSQIQEEFPEIKLTVIGDGPMRMEYEKLAKDLLGKNYQFLGWQSNDIVLDYISKAYLFSMPSITMPSGAAESFGLVFVEAQALGVPVVSFFSGGIPEVVAHGQTGLLAKEGDVVGLAQNIKLLLSDLTLHDEMSHKAEERVAALFDLDKQNAELENVYKTVLNTAG